MNPGTTTWLRRAFAGLLMGGMVLFSAGCVGVAYPPGPPGVDYDYDYYPDAGIYFYPAGRIYYWNEGGHWRSGRRLPQHYIHHEGHPEHLRLHTRTPWTEHHPERVQPERRGGSGYHHQDDHRHGRN